MFDGGLIEILYNFVTHFSGYLDDTYIIVKLEDDTIKIIIDYNEAETFSLSNNDSEFYDWVKFIVQNTY